MTKEEKKTRSLKDEDVQGHEFMFWRCPHCSGLQIDEIYKVKICIWCNQRMDMKH